MFGKATRVQLENAFSTYMWYMISCSLMHSFIYIIIPLPSNDTMCPVQIKRIRRGFP